MNTTFWIVVWLSFSGGLTADVQGQTNVSASLSVKRAISSSLSGSTQVSAGLARGMDGTILASSIVYPSLSIVRSITGNVSVSSTVYANYLSRYAARTSTISDTTTVGSYLYRNRGLGSSPSGVTQVATNLNAYFALSSTVSPATGVTSNLSASFAVPADTVTGQTTVSASLSGDFFHGIIYGQSQVNASLRVQRRVSSSISGLSSVSGNLNANRAVQSSITNATDVSVSLAKIYDLLTSVSGSTSDSGRLNAVFSLSGNISGLTSSAIGANLSHIHNLASSITGVTSVNANAGANRKLLSSIVGTDSTTGNLSVARAVQSVVNGNIVVSADLRLTAWPLQVTVIGGSSVVGQMHADDLMDSVVTGASGVSGSLSAKIAVNSDIHGVSGVSVSLKSNVALYVSTSKGVSSVSASIEAESELVGVSTGGRSSVIAHLSAFRPVSTSIQGKSSLSSSLSLILKAASFVNGQSTVNGALSTIRETSGTSSGWSFVFGEIGLGLELISSIQGQSIVSPNLSGIFRLDSASQGLSTFVGGGMSAVFDLIGDISVQSIVISNLSAVFQLASSSQGQSSVTVSIATGSQLESVIIGQSTVWAGLKTVYGIGDTISGTTSVVGYLAATHDLVADVLGQSSVSGDIIRTYQADSDIYGHSSVSGNLSFIIIVSAYSGGQSSVSGDIDFNLSFVEAEGTIYGQSDVIGGLAITFSYDQDITGNSSLYALLNLDISVSGAFAQSRAGVFGSLEIRGALYGGDLGGVFSQSGGSERLALVSEDLQVDLPDWMPVYRGVWSLLGALVESVRLSLGERAIYELTPLAMDPRHFLSVWECSLEEKPKTVAHPDYWFRIAEAKSWYELMHSPLPRWYWEGGRLYVSRLAVGMEKVNLLSDRFQIASSVPAISTHPVYLLWTRVRGDIVYLVPPGRLRWALGRLSEIRPKFGYLLHAREDLQLGSDYGQYHVSAKANVWLTFQSSSGGDNLPDCAPVRVNLLRHGFVSVVVHHDDVRLTAMRGVRIVHPGEGSLSSCVGERGALVGVFVGTGAPSSVTPSNDPYAPAIGQVFVIESGARYMVPSGATRLMLGILHDGAYRFGLGRKVVTVHQYEPDGALTVIYSDANRLIRDQRLLVDGMSIRVEASSVENRYTMWMRMLGHPLSLRGWNGHDYVNYLRGAGFRVPVLPGMPLRWYRWEGQGDLVINNPSVVNPSIRHLVDVTGVPMQAIWTGVTDSTRLPYYPTGDVEVDGKFGTPSSGSSVRMRVPFWSYRQVGGVITVRPEPNLKMISGNFLVGVTPYEVDGLPFRVSIGGENPVFMFGDEVS